MNLESYSYRIRGDFKDVGYIRANFPAYEYLFNPGGRTWSPTNMAIEENIEALCKRCKEVTITLEFNNVNRDEHGLILFANGRKRWIR